MSEDVLAEIATRASARERHLGAVFEAVLTRGPLSRRDTARLTGLSPAAVTKLVKPMISNGYLLERDREAGVPGHPQIPLEVDSRRHYAIGIKLMRGELVGVIADLHAEVQSSHRIKFDDLSPEGAVEAIVSLTETLLSSSPAAKDRLLGIGIGLGGHVDGTRGIVVHAPFLDWHDVPLKKLVSERIGVDVALENDVNALALAEQWFGPGSAYESFAVVTLGVGIGCALVIDGTLWRGVGGSAGELGHMVVAPDGPLCHCGKRGCLEATVGDEGIVEMMSSRSGRRFTAVSQVIAAAHSGDEYAQGVFAEAGVAVGRAIATVLNLLNPPLVVLSGEGLSASDLFIDSLRTELTRDSFSTAARDCTLLVRPLPDETWARGAAATMLRQGVLRSLSRLTDTLADSRLTP